MQIIASLNVDKQEYLFEIAVTARCALRRMQNTSALILDSDHRLASLMDLLSIVIHTAAELSEMRHEDIRADHRLIGDLEMDEDDFSFVFVPRLEKMLGVKTSPAVWETVSTIGDVVEVFQKRKGE